MLFFFAMGKSVYESDCSLTSWTIGWWSSDLHRPHARGCGVYFSWAAYPASYILAAAMPSHIVLQSTCSRWIRAENMHPSGSEDCGEQKVWLWLSSIYVRACIWGSTSKTYLRLSSGSSEALSQSISAVIKSSGSSSVTPRPVHTLCHRLILGATHTTTSLGIHWPNIHTHNNPCISSAHKSTTLQCDLLSRAEFKLRTPLSPLHERFCQPEPFLFIFYSHWLRIQAAAFWTNLRVKYLWYQN